MTINIAHLSVTELEALAVEVQAEIQRKKALARKSLMSDIEKLAREAGVSLDEIFGKTQGKKAKAPVAAKYRNPNDASQTWSGRGRQPLWLAGLLAAGAKLEEFAIC